MVACRDFMPEIFQIRILAPVSELIRFPADYFLPFRHTNRASPMLPNLAVASYRWKVLEAKISACDFDEALSALSDFDKVQVPAAVI
jgi:hypothetical protein